MAPRRGSGAIRKRDPLITTGIDRFSGTWSLDTVTKEVGDVSARKGGSRQLNLIPRSKRSTISLPDNHPMVILTDTVDWVREELIPERTLVEGSIGTIKGHKYGFNHPAARSAAMMGACGQRAALGFNLTKLVRKIAEKQNMRLAW
jgi:hypothetical protein